MKKITRDAADRFVLGLPFKRSNTKVLVWPNLTVMELFGNRIAYKYGNGTLLITNARWPTVTTKERLNGIAGVSIWQANWIWYLNGSEWDGSLINIEQ